MTKASSKIIKSGSEIVRATKSIFEERIRTQPIPTKTTHVVEDRKKKSFGLVEHVSVLEVGTRSQVFRVGVVYDFMFRHNISIETLRQVDRSADKEQFRAVIVPFVVNLPQKIKSELESFSCLRCIQLTELEQGEIIRADFYFSAPTLGSQTAINQGNAYAAEVYKNIKKISHMILSDIAAEEYDEKYASSNFGTRCYMNLEHELVEAECKKLVSKDCAIDLGCGTGRHTFLLGNYFTKVIGYDFSTGMIKKANEKKRAILEAAKTSRDEKTAAGRVEFSVRDVELFPPDVKNNVVSFISASFGMGSFVEDLDLFLENCKRLLKVDGRIFLSFYNREAVHCLEPPPWRNNALSAQLDNASDEVVVRLWEGTSFKIFCKSWVVDEILVRMRLHFSDVRVVTIPKIAGVLPSDYPAGDTSALARELLTIERSLATNTNFQHGSYLIAVGTRGAEIDPVLFFVSENSDLQRRQSTQGIFVFEGDNDNAVELAQTTKGLLVRAEFGFKHEAEHSPHERPFVYILPHNATRNESFLAGAFGRRGRRQILDDGKVARMYGAKHPTITALRALRQNVTLLLDPSIPEKQMILVPGFGRHILCESSTALRNYLIGS